MRPAAAALLLPALACAAGAARPPLAPEAAHAGPSRCLLLAPFENASDAPHAGEAATAAVRAALDPARTAALADDDLRALFRDTPLELPEGVSPSLALELAELTGADAAVYGAVEGRSRDAAAPALLVSLRVVAAGGRDLLVAETVPVRPGAGEAPEDAIRRALAAARPALARLGDASGRRCFDPARLGALRGVAMAEVRRQPAPAPAAAVVVPVAAPAPPAAPGPAAEPAGTRTPRQAEWARRLAAGERFVLEDAAFAGRTADLQRDGGLADLVVALAAVPGVAVRVEAFVDATADAVADQRLTQAMADAATGRLRELGVAAARLTGVGYGGERPLLPNFTVRGRTANRRLEIVGHAGP
ncbi:OmpA family protein [Anaeromyxobacter dehalogenans]|uniref:Outer membrane protein, OmpA/MotB family n=1 Tax=Anaeromyxobacter dehalogenans (strain 2CP-C) TaxID=290397 RepID=Q2IGR5_ANADE|nr:OmpA family protein [Anaeromyxobacter dehalogenans]ABC83774.1 outer membrane protein, OmpA/MotB family [Anaeromyxobacter dehalogenans 2CP-C]